MRIRVRAKRHGAQSAVLNEDESSVSCIEVDVRAPDVAWKELVRENVAKRTQRIRL